MSGRPSSRVFSGPAATAVPGPGSTSAATAASAALLDADLSAPTDSRFPCAVPRDLIHAKPQPLRQRHPPFPCQHPPFSALRVVKSVASFNTIGNVSRNSSQPRFVKLSYSTILHHTSPLQKKDRSRKLGSSTTTSEEPKRQRTENTNTMTISRLPSDSPSIYNHIHERIRNPVRGRLMPLADQGDFVTGTAANGGTRPPNM